MKIENAVALVTGANRGLGRALVDELLRAGAARVYAGVRRLDAIDAKDARVVPVRLDVTRPDDVEALAKLDGVTLAINNAGLLGSFGVLSTTSEELTRELAINLFGVLAVTKTVLPSLEKARGALVNVLSIASLAGMPALGGYAVSKAAAFSLTQSLRADLRPRGVAVHAVFPGPIDTDMIKAMEMPKTSATEVARAIVAGVARGEENIAPDPMAHQVLAAWMRDPTSVEKQFAAM